MATDYSDMILEEKLDEAKLLVERAKLWLFADSFQPSCVSIRASVKRPLWRVLFFRYRTGTLLSPRRKSVMSGWVDGKCRINLWEPFVLKQPVWVVASVLTHELMHVKQWRDKGLWWITTHLGESEKEADSMARTFVTWFFSERGGQ